MTGWEGLTVFGPVRALVVGPAVLPVVLGVVRLASGLVLRPSLVSSLALGSRVPRWIRLLPWLSHLGWVEMGWLGFLRLFLEKEFGRVQSLQKRKRKSQLQLFVNVFSEYQGFWCWMRRSAVPR